MQIIIFEHNQPHEIALEIRETQLIGDGFRCYINCMTYDDLGKMFLD